MYFFFYIALPSAKTSLSFVFFFLLDSLFYTFMKQLFCLIASPYLLLCLRSSTVFCFGGGVGYILFPYFSAPYRPTSYISLMRIYKI